MIVLLTGVAGSGKTTVGKRLAQELGWPFCDGDDFHPPANVEKMERGIPLTDADRAAQGRLAGELSDRLGVRIESHDVLLRGACARCN